MTTERKKAGPPGGVGSPEHKAAQDAKNKNMAGVLDALAGAVKGPALRAALIEHKRQRGRPETGRTPDKDRKAKQRDLLRQAGGRSVSLDLTPEQAAQLDAIKAHKGHETDAAAVLALLVLGAKRAAKAKT